MGDRHFDDGHIGGDKVPTCGKPVECVDDGRHEHKVTHDYPDVGGHIDCSPGDVHSRAGDVGSLEVVDGNEGHQGELDQGQYQHDGVESKPDWTPDEDTDSSCHADHAGR